MIGAQVTRRLSARPRKVKPRTDINCGVASDLYELLYPVCSSLGWIHLVMSHPLFCF
ncbi:hypothetical protein ACQKGA_18925 [Priestia megaterium]|uniref:hypothetical protein n=1 Tax=Priestia megaterium TaxID=1404 RepID=UPI003CEF73B8